MTKVVNALAISKKLESNGIVLAEPVYQKMAIAGFVTEEQQAALITVAVLAGIDYRQLDLEENIRAARVAWKFTEDFGAIPGVDYYATPYDKKEKQGNDWVVVGKTYAIVRATKWLQSSVDARGDIKKVRYQLETRPVLGERAKELLDYYTEGEYVEHKLNRVFQARYVPFENGVATIGPDANWSVGFYLHEGYWYTNKKGERYKANGDGGRAQSNPNNTGAFRAERRAIRNAAKKITQDLMPIDKKSAEERIRAMLQIAYEKAVEGKLIAPEEAADFNPGLDGDDIIDGEYSDADLKVQAAAASIDVPDALPEEENDDQALADSVGAVSLPAIAIATFDNLPVEMQGLVNKIQAARSGADIPTEAMSQLRDWVGMALKDIGVVAGEQVEGAGISGYDLVVRVIFGGNVGEALPKDQANIFWPTISKLKGKAREYVKDSEGARLVQEVYAKALEAVANVDAF